jgi:hypothetical protein
MWSAESARAAASVWDIATPTRQGLRGVSMAGFRDRAGVVELTAIPYPAVTVVVDFGDESLVVDHANGAERGSVVAGLAPDKVRVRGRNIECLQIRLSPVVAHAMMGSAELSGTVIALGDLLGAGRRANHGTTAWGRVVAGSLRDRRGCARSTTSDRPRGRSGGRLRLGADDVQPRTGSG